MGRVTAKFEVCGFTGVWQDLREPTKAWCQLETYHHLDSKPQLVVEPAGVVTHQCYRSSDKECKTVEFPEEKDFNLNS